MKTNIIVNARIIALSLSAVAQTNSQTTMTVEPLARTPDFRVNVISRNVQAVNYRHRSGATKLDFAGTDLMPSANGEAKVDSKRGSIEIEAEFGNLQKPTTFGNEYLTYILWAISPEGRAVNLGEVLVGGNPQQAGRDHGPSGFRSDRYRGTLLCRSAAQQPSRARKCCSRGHERNYRGSECKVRAYGAGRLHSHRLQVRPCDSECQVAVGILRGAECAAHRSIRGSRAIRQRQLSARCPVDEQGGRYATRKHVDRKAADRSRPRGSTNCRRCPRDRGQEDGRGAPSERTPGLR